ncbi:MAG: NAD-dependent deacylase [Lentimicrobiaceae bacterium]|jgi:NAD-dependent deacetylase|nr:NAD-dependent deacylase [Lentimicrobiaceae bacterium]
MIQNKIQEVSKLLLKSKYLVAFTGAGVSVESGIPPFRGDDGLYNQYDPRTLEIDYYYQYPEKSWQVIKEIFYDFFEQKHPNEGHKTLAKWESEGLLKALITQNIDNLHALAGSETVFEFHGNSSRLVCSQCRSYFQVKDMILNNKPPTCPKCKFILKPDFVFFGEGIPQDAYNKSFNAASKCDLFFIIGTSGDVAPANFLPEIAKNQGATIIEINREPSKYTSHTTDIFLQGKSGEILPEIDKYFQKLIYE